MVSGKCCLLEVIYQLEVPYFQQNTVFLKFPTFPRIRQDPPMPPLVVYLAGVLLLGAAAAQPQVYESVLPLKVSTTLPGSLLPAFRFQLSQVCRQARVRF